MARRRAVTVGNMSNESKNSNDSAVPQSQQSEPQTPRTFPKSNYIRPGIDDRPDLDKALSAEDKSAVARLAVRQKPVTAPPAATHPEVQASDEPIPDVESAFFDLRDPMVDSTGYRPTHTQVLRMKSGFAAASLLLSFAMVALTVVLVPLRLDEFGGAFDGTVNLAVLIGVGIVDVHDGIRLRDVGPHASFSGASHTLAHRRHRGRHTVCIRAVRMPYERRDDSRLGVHAARLCGDGDGVLRNGGRDGARQVP